MREVIQGKGFENLSSFLHSKGFCQPVHHPLPSGKFYHFYTRNNLINFPSSLVADRHPLQIRIFENSIYPTLNGQTHSKNNNNRPTDVSNLVDYQVDEESQRKWDKLGNQW